MQIFNYMDSAVTNEGKCAMETQRYIEIEKGVFPKLSQVIRD